MLTTRALAPLTLLVVVGLAACSGAGAPPSSPGPSATPVPTPTAVPGDPGSGGGSGGGSGAGSGGTGSGIVIPIPGDPARNPLFGNATYVTPSQGLLNLHQVSVQLVRAVLSGDGSATVDLRWWSGVPPCTQLGDVQVGRDDAAKTIRIAVIEGSGGGQVACIDIAQLTATQVQLDPLASGTWTIAAQGDASPITVDVP
jgi:hypothetical protein